MNFTPHCRPSLLSLILSSAVFPFWFSLMRSKTPLLSPLLSSWTSPAAASLHRTLQLHFPWVFFIGSSREQQHRNLFCPAARPRVSHGQSTSEDPFPFVDPADPSVRHLPPSAAHDRCCCPFVHLHRDFFKLQPWSPCAAEAAAV